MTQITVADEMMLAALPEDARRKIVEIVRRAHLAGWSAAKDDQRAGRGDVDGRDERACIRYLEANVHPVFGTYETI